MMSPLGVDLTDKKMSDLLNFASGPAALPPDLRTCTCVCAHNTLCLYLSVISEASSLTFTLNRSRPAD